MIWCLGALLETILGEILVAKPARKCKLCNLLKINQDLWVAVHNKIIEDGLSKSVVCKWLNGQVETLNTNLPKDKKLPTFNTQNFTYHFKKHISDSAKMKIELDKALKNRRDTSFSDAQIAMNESMSHKKISGEVDDLLFMVDMVKTLETLLVEHRDSLLKDRSAGKLAGGAFSSKLETVFKLTTEVISQKQKLAQLKTADRVAGIAVSEAVTRVVRGMLETAADAAEKAKKLVDGGANGDDVSKSIIEQFGSNTETLVYETVEIIKNDFGIK